MLVDSSIEIGSESISIDMWPSGGKGQKLGPRHKGSARRLDWAKLCDRDAVASDDEALTADHGFDHLGIVVPELSLGNGLCHGASVALIATPRYALVNVTPTHPGQPIWFSGGAGPPYHD
jgi:hypothetical protein